MIAFCGLNCAECPAYLATREDSDEKRNAVAKLWSQEFKADIKPEDINCDGCLSEDGRLFSHCKVCGIRACGRGKTVANCGRCGEYPCPKLDFVFAAVPAAKATLDEIANFK